MSSKISSIKNKVTASLAFESLTSSKLDLAGVNAAALAQLKVVPPGAKVVNLGKAESDGDLMVGQALFETSAESTDPVLLAQANTGTASDAGGAVMGQPSDDRGAAAQARDDKGLLGQGAAGDASGSLPWLLGGGALALAGGGGGGSNSAPAIKPAAPLLLDVLTASDTAGPNGTSADNLSKDTTPTVQVTFKTMGEGAAKVGDVVMLYAGATKVGQATLSGTDVTNGYVEITTSALGSSANYVLTATITDNGLTSDASTPLTYTLDTLASVTLSAISGGYINKAEATGGQMVDGIASNVEAGQTVTVTLSWNDGSPQTETFTGTVQANGSWSTNITQAFLFGLTAETNFTVTATVTDKAGNVANLVTPYALTYNPTTPSVGIDTPISTDGFVNDAEDESSLTITGTSFNVTAGEEVKLTLTDGHNTVTLTGVVGSVVGENGTWSVVVSSADLKSLNQGSITLTADIDPGYANYDAEATPGTASYVYDISPPTTATIRTILDDVSLHVGDLTPGSNYKDGNPGNDKVWFNDATPTLNIRLSADAQEGDLLEIYNDGELIGTHYCTALEIASGTVEVMLDMIKIGNDAVLEQGRYDLSLTTTMTDKAGNTGVQSDPVALTVWLDTVKPIDPTVDEVWTRDPGSTTTGPTQVFISGNVGVYNGTTESPITYVYTVLSDQLDDNSNLISTVVDSRYLDVNFETGAYNISFDSKNVDHVNLYALQTLSVDEAGNTSDPSNIAWLIMGKNQQGENGTNSSGDLIDVNQIISESDLIGMNQWEARPEDEGMTVFAFNGQDTVLGSDKGDLIFGGMGRDSLMGGLGDDTVYGGDSERHSQDQGDYLDGGAGDDALYGENQSDTLVGGAGNDTMTGGDQADQFVFNAALGANNVDTIVDFKLGNDKIMLDDDVFSMLSGDANGVALNSANFKVGTSAATASQYIIYNQSTGELYYDADGNGAGEQVLFAVLENKPTTVTAADFSIIA